MKIVHISDTHNQTLTPPEGDVLIHSGDLTLRGNRREVTAALSWLEGISSGYSKILVTPGNHDFLFEFESMTEECTARGLVLLQDSGTCIDGINFWGSPFSPAFGNWAFGQGPEKIRETWSLIPQNTDVLITHGPPWCILDGVPRGPGMIEHVGCLSLLDRVLEISPKLHCFGHIHEGYGFEKVRDTLFSNASLLDGYYQMTNEPLVWEVNK